MEILKKYLLALPALLVAFSCGSSLPVMTISQEKPGSIPNNYDAEIDLSYHVSTNGDNLLVALETGDVATQLKMIRNGVSVQFDPAGKQREHTALTYPIFDEAPMERSDMQAARGNQQEFLNTMLSNLPDDILFNNNGQTTYLNKLVNNKGITVSMTTDQGQLMYKIELPLSLIPKLDGQTPAMGIVIEGLQRPAGAQAGGGPPAGMGGGRPSGGFGGGRPAGVGGPPSGMGGRPSGQTGSSGGFQNMSKTTEIWFLMDVSTKPR